MSTDHLNSMEYNKRSLRSVWAKTEAYLNTVNHIIIGIVAIYMTIICYRAGGYLYNWHAWCCTIGVSEKNTMIIFASC